MDSLKQKSFKGLFEKLKNDVLERERKEIESLSNEIKQNTWFLTDLSKLTSALTLGVVGIFAVYSYETFKALQQKNQSYKNLMIARETDEKYFKSYKQIYAQFKTISAVYDKIKKDCENSEKEHKQALQEYRDCEDYRVKEKYKKFKEKDDEYTKIKGEYDKIKSEYNEKSAKSTESYGQYLQKKGEVDIENKQYQRKYGQAKGIYTVSKNLALISAGSIVLTGTVNFCLNRYYNLPYRKKELEKRSSQIKEISSLIDKNIKKIGSKDLGNDKNQIDLNI